jgi:hypothetical protein
LPAPATGTNNITVTYRAGALNSLDLTASVFGAGTVAAPSVVSLAANNTGLVLGQCQFNECDSAVVPIVPHSAPMQHQSAQTQVLGRVDGGAGIDGNVTLSGQVPTLLTPLKVPVLPLAVSKQLAVLAL